MLLLLIGVYMEILILCITIFFARIIDVSLGTVRLIVIVKGRTFLAAIIAFIEVLVWFLIAREALNTALTSFWIPIAFAGGFATGTLIGSVVAKKFIKGVIGVQIITTKLSSEMIENIKAEGIGVSIIKLESVGETDKKDMLYIQVSNYKLKKLQQIVKKIDKDAFIVVNETKYVQNGFIK